jgi:hypothetical protein
MHGSSFGLACGMQLGTCAAHKPRAPKTLTWQDLAQANDHPHSALPPPKKNKKRRSALVAKLVQRLDLQLDGLVAAHDSQVAVGAFRVVQCHLPAVGRAHHRAHLQPCLQRLAAVSTREANEARGAAGDVLGRRMGALHTQTDRRLCTRGCRCSLTTPFSSLQVRQLTGCLGTRPPRGSSKHHSDRQTTRAAVCKALTHHPCRQVRGARTEGNLCQGQDQRRGA